MSYDLVIKNGMVVDGSGMPRHRADVAIKDGKIVEKGRISPNGAKVIDAEGRYVAPGFIDVHTHYDAQVLWDPLVTCSPWHGVTTVVMGNCGFTLAPCNPGDRDFVTRMFAKVEGMNIDALTAGIDWQWRSFPEYLDVVDALPKGVNIGAMVGHSALRRFVIGPDADQRPSSGAEIEEMKGIVHDAMDHGAFGFTTSLSPTHFGWEGEPVPSRLATHEEVIELGSVLRDFRVGSIEIITETAVMGEDKFSETDQELMTALSLESGRPVNWNELSHTWDRPTAWRAQIEYMERAAKEGAQVYAVARMQRLDAFFNLKSTAGFERYFPEWKAMLSQTDERKKEMIADPAVRAKLKEEYDAVEPKLQWFRRLGNIALVRSATGKYAEHEGKFLGEIARNGDHLADVMLDIALDEDLNTEWAYIGIRNGDLNAVEEILNSRFALAGISDAGAHTDRLSGSYFSSFILSHWVRDEGILSLEEAVRRLTFMPASIYGISDKGLLREGMAADVVIFDLDRLKWLPTERFDDFPGGQSRLGNRAEGYDHLIVGGEPVFEDGRHTGALPGKLMRSNAYRYTG